jgi:hypothetical protein
VCSSDLAASTRRGSSTSRNGLRSLNLPHVAGQASPQFVGKGGQRIVSPFEGN